MHVSASSDREAGEVFLWLLLVSFWHLAVAFGNACVEEHDGIQSFSRGPVKQNLTMKVSVKETVQSKYASLIATISLQEMLLRPFQNCWLHTGAYMKFR